MIGQKFQLDFILSAHGQAAEGIRAALAEFADEVRIEELPQEEGCRAKDFRLRLKAAEPEAVFDLCSQFGRIKTVKVIEI
jgi:hypothetical protein